MSNPRHDSKGSSAWVDHIPAIWFEPHRVDDARRRLIIVLHHLGGTKETTVPYLQDLAADGFVALSLDAFQHGQRGTESSKDVAARVFGNFRRHMWPILGQTALDTLRVIDWALASLNVEPDMDLAGISMGGMEHLDVRDRERWWPDCKRWLVRP
ncbi:hypothetical protein [Paenibacillus flagellatus]|uniref:Serine aminopeptidase S33 domain-containing protein n=1 Tax=Paenibacillus flagellatus TaxID=2211139 RepID=A0A2V5KCF6_9BACL|nr:hypothetical protein [Paenibacillus flagellatus]PYI57281.1 hypothetical protein DLM86_02230 [Paenibacillus flagellatus]